jgi:hypothetical protein
MTVTVTGSFNGNKWVASTLLQKDAVEGLVKSIAANGLSLVVMGQTVVIDSTTLIDKNIPGQNILSLLQGIDSVEVNGHIGPNGEIQATFIERKDPGAVTPEVRGFVSAHDAVAKTFQIGALNVNYAGADISAMPLAVTIWDGLFVGVKATDPNSFDPGTTTLTASRVEPENQGLVLTTIDQFDVQGVVTQMRVDGTDVFLVGTTRVRTTASTQCVGISCDNIAVNARLSVHGQLANGILTATHVVANAAPVITSTPILVGTQGVAYSYDVNATDENGDTLTYSLVPPVLLGMTIDPATGLISWTPPAAANDYSVTVQASDGSLTASQSFIVKVAAAVAPAAPVFITTALPPALVQTLYTTTVHATDANGDKLTYSITAPPTGSSLVDMTIDPVSGVISWTPDVTQVGDKIVNVEAQDSTGRATSQTFTITVNAATAATGVAFGFDNLTKGGFNVTQPGLWTYEGPDTFSTFSGSAIIVRGDLTVIIDKNGNQRFNSPEFTFLGVTLIGNETTDTTFVVAGYNGSHGVTNFYYTKTVKAGDPPFRVQNSFPDNLNRLMNVSIDRLEVNGNSLFTPDFGVSCLGVGTAGGVLACP